MTNSSRSAARKDAQFLREVAERVTTMPKKLDTEKTSDHLKQLVKSRENHGEKLAKAGIVLILCPDPLTGVAGVPLFAAGELIRARQSISLKDAYSNLNQTLLSLASLRLD